MADQRDPPLLNPVLSLQMDPVPESPRGGGKGRESIVQGRLVPQQSKLRAQAQSLYGSRMDFPTFSGKTFLAVHMFSDSLAPSYTPKDLFASVYGCRLVAPLRNGYFVEADLGRFHGLAAAIRNPRSLALQVDISRVSDMMVFDDEARLRGHSVEDLWEAAPEDEGGRLFIIWLTPFRDSGAREALFATIGELSDDHSLLPVFPGMRLPARSDDTTAEMRPAPTSRQSSIARAMRSYRNTGVGHATVRVPDKECLSAIVASGTSFRIDPVRTVRVTSPGEGPHPAPPLQLEDAPTIAVIDGGLHATNYLPAEAWRTSPLVPDNKADRKHGNGVSSLAVHAYAWNNNRNLPALECRIGTVQAIPHRNSTHCVNEDELIDYLDGVARAHPDTRVWNISANQVGLGLDHEEVSVLGHELTRIARERDILPVVSVGNVGPYNSERPSPPADCEAAVVVGGREADEDGDPAQHCSVCLGGPGPDGMLKPDVSWFSKLRMLGGVTGTGSSYATPLVSSLAAHTFDALRDPTPDIVKALLINVAELDEHDPALGWGTPYHGHMPWNCEPGSVTLAWRAQLEPGTAYYWNDIPIPPELVRNGKLFGKARLTAVLNPLVSPSAGANYFASRLQISLQYIDKPGADWKSLLGPMKESTILVNDARDELKKWSPIRRHCADFTKQGGRQLAKYHFRLYARVYIRDLYQFGWNHHSQAGSQEAAFVLTLLSGEHQRSIYDSTVQELGNFVESAVLEQEIEQEIRRW